MIEKRKITKAHDAEHSAWRREFVTASVMGALFGCHDYVSKFKLYVEKRGVEFNDDSDNPLFRRGRWFEPAVGVAISEQHPDWEIEKNEFFYCDPEVGYGATPDFLIHGDPRGLGVLQAKTVTKHIFERDWRNGAEVPFWIVLQTLTESMLTGATFGAAAALVIDPYNPTCHLLEIPRHHVAEAKIITEVKKFWHEVEQGIEPQPDFAKDAALINMLTPRHEPGLTIDLSGNNEIPVMLARRAKLNAEIKRREAECEVIEAELKFLIGPAETVSGIPDWRITYKSRERKEYTVPAKLQRPLLIYDKRPESEREETM